MVLSPGSLTDAIFSYSSASISAASASFSIFIGDFSKNLEVFQRAEITTTATSRLRMEDYRPVKIALDGELSPGHRDRGAPLRGTKSH